MTPHSIFYYPYASLIEEQSVLLKAAALYFDKLYILDPMKARFKEIHIDEVEQDLFQLEQEGILERLAPEEVMKDYEEYITKAIQRDLKDEKFKELCAESGGSVWKIALAKVPKDIQQEESMRRAFRSAIPEHLRSDPDLPPKGYYDENRLGEGERKTRRYDYRFRNQGHRRQFPFEIGEAIMLNHALVGSILHAEAIPITDEEVHSRIFNYKIQQAQQVREIHDIVAEKQDQLKLASAKLAVQALTDCDLAVIPEDLSLEKILDYRRRYAGELQAVRDKMRWLAREITHNPWTKEFEDEVFHKAIPELNKMLGPVRSSWSKWLRSVRPGLGGAAVVVGLYATTTPLLTGVVAVAALTFSKEVLEGLEFFLDWKQGKTQNGLHYLLRLKRN